MGLKDALLQKAKRKSQSSSALNNSSNTSSTAAQPIEDPPLDSYERFLLEAQREEQSRLDLEGLEMRCKMRSDSWETKKTNKRW